MVGIFNRKQLLALWLGVLVSVWFVWRPPLNWITTYRRDTAMQEYGIAPADVPDHIDTVIDFRQLYAREAVTVLVTLAAMVTLSDRLRPRPRSSFHQP